MMNRSDLVEEFAELHNLSVPQAREYLDTFLSCIARALATGDRVTLDGFGVFTLRHRASRTMVNPATRRLQTIKEAEVPTFRASPRLRRLINEPGAFV